MTGGAKEPLRLGALGTSSIAWRRALPTTAAADEVDLVAVAGRDELKTARFAEHFGCEAAGFEAVLERADIEAVYISLPTSLHHEWTAKALRAGKHVLVEKPIGVDAAEARDLTSLAQACGLVLRENFMFLHHPQHAMVKELADTGRLGRLSTMQAAFCIPPLRPDDIRYVAELGGGALLDVGVYPLRAALLMLGEGVRVTGATLRTGADGLDLSGQALLVSPSGVMASVTFGFEHSYASSYSLWGDRARVGVSRAFTPPPGYQPVMELEEQDHVEQFTLPAADQLRSSFTAFAAAVRKGDAAGSAEEARWRQQAVAGMELVDAVRECATRVTVDG